MAKLQQKTLNSSTMIIMIIVGAAFVSSKDAPDSKEPFSDGIGNANAPERTRRHHISESTLSGRRDGLTHGLSFGAPWRKPTFVTNQPPLSIRGEAHLAHHEIDKSNQENTNSSRRSTNLTQYHRHPVKYAESSQLPSSPSSQRSPAPSKKDTLLLHRHKRYLVFPEGSSFQLSFDLVLPIVDYTNYAILGITCAIAWELPSKPASEIIEHFRQKLNRGTFGLARRNDSVEELQHLPPLDRWGNGGIDGQPTDVIGSAENFYYSNQPDPSYSRPTWRHSFDSAERQSPNTMTAEWTSHTKWRRSPDIERQKASKNRKILNKHPQHRIYPLYGNHRRRRFLSPAMDDQTSKLHEIHTKDHLQTRHKLYGKIEKLYRTRGYNGSACILRTLCEIHREHRQHEQLLGPPTPRSFVMELLRAMFTLPQDTVAATSRLLGPHYVDAVRCAHQVPSCRQRYEGCELPIWNGMQF
uniref:Uncharacterized protein n=1 Tax=Musca domestica TaxID=7370 RepID=A0A1I8MUS7_MUSDO